MRIIARAYGPYDALASIVWFTIAAPSTNQPMHADVGPRQRRIVEDARVLRRAVEQLLDQLVRDRRRASRCRSRCRARGRPRPAPWRAATILRRSLGARVIQLPSGSMPTISECACCDIIRMSCLRYRSGIQSFGSIVSPRGDARLEGGHLAGSSCGCVRDWVIASAPEGPGAGSAADCDSRRPSTARAWPRENVHRRRRIGQSTVAPAMRMFDGMAPRSGVDGTGTEGEVSLAVDEGVGTISSPTPRATRFPARSSASWRKACSCSARTRRRA